MAQNFKATLEKVVENLATQIAYVQSMIDDIDVRIKKNKEAGNVPNTDSLSPNEKEGLQNFIKEKVATSSLEKSSKQELTTAKKLMPKIHEKV